MKSLIKNAVITGIHKILRLSGIALFFREVVNRRKLTVLLYHKVEPKVFKVHMQWLVKHYNFISLADLISDRALPIKPLMITFDDGHADNFLLLPEIKRCRIPVLIFITTGLINTKRRFWFDVVGEREELLRLMSINNDEKNRYLAEEYDYALDKEYAERSVLSEEEISIMKSSKLVTFQPHTVSHPVLPRLSDEVMKNEIKESINMLESIGIQSLSFASPFGKHGPREESYLRECGIKYLFTTDDGVNKSIPADLAKIRRVGIPEEASLDNCIARVSGLWSFVRNIPFASNLSSFKSMEKLH